MIAVVRDVYEPVLLEPHLLQEVPNGLQFSHLCPSRDFDRIENPLDTKRGDIEGKDTKFSPRPGEGGLYRAHFLFVHAFRFCRVQALAVPRDCLFGHIGTSCLQAGEQDFGWNTVRVRFQQRDQHAELTYSESLSCEHAWWQTIHAQEQRHDTLNAM
jgi:hypothetical protein